MRRGSAAVVIELERTSAMVTPWSRRLHGSTKTASDRTTSGTRADSNPLLAEREGSNPSPVNRRDRESELCDDVAVMKRHPIVATAMTAFYARHGREFVSR